MIQPGTRERGPWIFLPCARAELLLAGVLCGADIGGRLDTDADTARRGAGGSCGVRGGDPRVVWSQG